MQDMKGTKPNFVYEEVGELTSFSDVPQTLQHLHSMHCQRYVFTAAIITAVNCRQDGCPEKKRKLKMNVDHKAKMIT